ncbi:VirB10/TraB/TrbI family type IV secretion system protein [Yersinia enterocolitica]|uniref:VirB10/TraB/TrbI family type IV secretion system protein n=1 Tax=Yersinia enterocolitica TaxID=630 RepID=UPI001C60EE6D|nr:VirB10/TraB/TrbI family type IV secretion system protein [Yersinia enterocolitica]MBW5840016.1 TrbI/VirB10 family protein [Yersinia enterocolitica]
MSEQENKIPTATEIERQLREHRQKELKQAENTSASKSDKPTLQLGIEKLKKSRKGMIIIVVGFLLLAIGVSVYYIPSIIRSVSSGDDKPTASQPLATGAAKRQTGLSEDIDPFNTAQKKTEKPEEQKVTPAEKPKQPENKQQDFSRALDVSLEGSQTGSSSSSGTTPVSRTATSESESDKKTDVKATSQTTELVPQAKITKVTYNPNLFIPEGTSIPCSLDRRFVSDLAGKLECTINSDIYSANGNVKLIERGTSAKLMYKAGTLRHGQGRVFVMAYKLRTRRQPFIDIPLIDSQAAGTLGEAGASGWIDTHFYERFFGAMMVGVIPDLSQAASGLAKDNRDNQTDYTANSRQAFADIAREAFSNSVNIPPTLYKNQGEIITLIIGQDLDFSGIYKLKMKGG